MSYTPGFAEEAMDQGKTMFLDSWASWCSTCAAQDRAIEGLRAADPAHDAAITFITVDWDAYGDAPISRDLGIPRRSTLIALMGRVEIGRIIAPGQPARAEDDVRVRPSGTRRQVAA